jgi:general secretion pathway protein G
MGIEMKKGRNMKKRSIGFTLLELIIVLALVATVGGFIAFGLIEKGDGAKINAAKIHISSIGQSLDLYKLDIGRYPTSAEGLQALVTAPGGVNNWNGPYHREKGGGLPKDPWSNDYRYVSPAASAPYEIVSLGADGREGGEAGNRDVSNLK